MGDAVTLDCHWLPFLRDLHSNLAVIAVNFDQNDSVSFYTVIGCHWLSFLRDLHSNLAGIAVILCQNDSVPTGRRDDRGRAGPEHRALRGRARRRRGLCRHSSSFIHRVIIFKK